MAIPLSYNVRNVVQRPLQTLATSVGVGLTVAILIGALALAEGFQRALRSSGSEQNAIFLRKGADGEISSGISRDAANLLRAMPQVAKSPSGVPMASPEVVVLIFHPRKNGGGSTNLTVRGLETEGIALRDGVRVIEGRPFAQGADEIVVGKKVRDRFEGCSVGQKLRLGTRDVEIVGVFEAGESSFESEVWGDSKVLMPLFRGEVFQSVTVRLADPSTFAAWKEEVARDPRLQLDGSIERAFYEKQSELLAGVLRGAGVFITLIMAVGAVFGAMNTMFATVASRTREVSTLLILGFSPFAVMLSFVIESVILSLLGGALGVLFALPVHGMTTSTTNFASFSEVAFSFDVTPDSMLTGMIFAGAMGLVGGFLPALKAARQPLAQSLREM